MITGTSNKLTKCTGCLEPISSRIKHFRCHFSTKGFSWRGVTLKPCGVLYHVGCITVGEPFRTRLPGRQGLSYPDVDGIPIFVCEACSVRNVLLRELRTIPGDLTLMRLERMRMVDTACRWAESTLAHYQSYFRRIREFEKLLDCPVLQPPVLASPPGSHILPTLWCQQ